VRYTANAMVLYNMTVNSVWGQKSKHATTSDHRLHKPWTISTTVDHKVILSRINQCSQSSHKQLQLSTSS